MKIHSLTPTTSIICVKQNHSILNCGYSQILLIDTGINEKVAREVVRLLREKKKEIRYVMNTHGHLDHSGGNEAVKELTGAKLIATKEQQPFLEQEGLLTTYSYGADPVGFDATKTRMTTSRVDELVKPGNLSLDDNSFELLETKGHSLDHLSIATEDRVLFCGDILMSDELLKHHGIPLIFNVEKILVDLDFIENSNFNHYVHAHLPFDVDQFAVIQKNRKRILEVLEQIYSFCQTPRSRDEITGHLMVNYGKLLSPSRFIVMHHTSGAVINYLLKKKSLTVDIQQGILKYNHIC